MTTNLRLVVPSGSLINGQHSLSHLTAAIVQGLVALCSFLFIGHAQLAAADDTDPKRWANVKAWQGTITLRASGSGWRDGEPASETVVTVRQSLTIVFSGVGDGSGFITTSPSGHVTVHHEMRESCPPHSENKEDVDTVEYDGPPPGSGFSVLALQIDPTSGIYHLNSASFPTSKRTQLGCDGPGSTDAIPHGVSCVREPIAPCITAPLPESGFTLSGSDHFLAPTLFLPDTAWDVTWHFSPEVVDDKLDDPCKEGNSSTIYCENQALGEDIGIVGTPFALHYQSDRAPGTAGVEAVAIAHGSHLGGWSLDVHHTYNPAKNILFRGDGERRDSVALGTVNARADGTFLIASQDGREAYVFDGSGQHLRTVNTFTAANRYQFAYDGGGRLASVTDGDSNITKIERDSAGNPAAIVGPFGQRTTLAIGADGYLAKITNPAGEAVTSATDAKGLLIGLIDPRNNASVFTYDSNGKLIRDQNAADGFHSLARTEVDGAYSVSRSTAMSRTTTYHVTKRAGGGEDRVVTQPNGVVTNASRSDNGSRSVETADGTQTALSVSPDPRFGRSAPLVAGTTTITPAGLAAVSSINRTVALTDPADPLSLSGLTETLTLNGRKYTSTFDAAAKTFTNLSPEGRQAMTTIDTQGRPVTEQTGGLLPSAYSYNAQGRIMSAIGGSGLSARTTNFNYNAQGYLESLVDPLGRKTSFNYDAAGRITRQKLPDERAVVYGYDAKGNLVSLTPPGRPAHLFDYTAVDLQRQYTPPDVAAGTNSTVYTYNLDKQLTRITRPDSRVIDLAYDNAGRLSTLTLPSGQISYGYDATTGKLTGITAPDGGTLAYTYNGALLTQTAWGGVVAGSVGRIYDNDFRVTSLSVNGVDAIALQYDADSLLTKAGNLTLSRNAQNGLLTGSTLGNVTDTLSYNGFAEPINYSAVTNGASLYKVQYNRDKLGRITEKTETIGGATDTYGYTYDLAGRLTEVKKNDTTIASYTYDSNGNRLSFTDSGGTTTGIHDNQDRLTEYGGIIYAYTANGELKSKAIGSQTTTYQYDGLGNLIAVAGPTGTQITYLVDSRNRRIGKQVNGTLVQGFLYQDGLKPIAELDGANHVVSRFVYATHINVPDYLVKGGVTYRIITDHLGSPRLVVDVSTGAVVQRMEYDEFGQVLTDTNPGFQPFGFAGGLYDRETGFVRFGLRDYDAEAGRWTSKDPIGFAAAQSNLYSYALGDPVNHIDPIGLSWKAIAKTIIRTAVVIANTLSGQITEEELQGLRDRAAKEGKKCPGRSSDDDDPGASGGPPPPVPEEGELVSAPEGEEGDIEKALITTVGIGAILVAQEIATAAILVRAATTAVAPVVVLPGQFGGTPVGGAL